MIPAEELELRIVGTLLLYPEKIGETITVLDPSDFDSLGPRTLFRAMAKLFLAGKPTDQLSVLLEAGDDCQVVLDAILEGQLYASDLGYYCQLLREQSRLRVIRDLGRQLSQAETDAAAESLLSKLNGAFSGKRNAKIYSISEMLVRFWDRIGSEETPAYLPWGFKELEEKLYVELGDFVVIGGQASSGKTLLALQFAVEMAKNYRVGYFSLETSDIKLTTRMVASAAGVSLGRIKRRDLAQSDLDAMATASRELEKLTLEVIDEGYMSVPDIQAVTLSKKFQVIFIDYLQDVQGSGHNRYEQVTSISLGLHRLAQSHGVTVIALAQLSRPERTKDRNGKPIPPNMNSFRESGQIEQDADVAMLLYPLDPDNNGANRMLKVSKNKDGEKVAIELVFDGPTQRLTPAPKDKQVMRQLQEQGRKAKQQVRNQVAIEGFQELPGPDPDLPF